MLEVLWSLQLSGSTGGGIEVSEKTPPFTIDQFYKFVAERKLMGARCCKCNNVMVPPRMLCNKCYSQDIEWTELRGKGRLLTYTECHQPIMAEYKSMVPYIIGVVKLEEGPQIPTMMRNLKREDVQIGMELIIDFDTKPSPEWPFWTHYFFIRSHITPP